MNRTSDFDHGLLPSDLDFERMKLDVFDRLNRLGSAPHVVAPLRMTVRGRLLRRVRDRGSDGPTVRRPSRRRTLGKIGLATALVALALVVTSFVIPRGAATAEAAEVLRKAALATSTTDPAVGMGQFLLITTTATSTGIYSRSAAIQENERRLMYAPADTNGEWFLTTEITTPGRVYGDIDGKEMARYLNHAPIGQVRAYQGAEGAFGGMFVFPTAAEFAVMPRDPDALLRYLYEVSTGSSSKDEAVFQTIHDELLTGLAPADLRSAMFDVVAKIPGVYLERDVANLAGRHGAAISRKDNHGQVTQLVIDPTNGRFIGVQSVTTEKDGILPAGTVTNSSATEMSVVDAVPALTYIVPRPAG